MPITISGKTYYRTIEVCRIVGISRNTLFRWLREGTFADVESVDRRGWRLFTEEDINRLKIEANRVRHNNLRFQRETKGTAD
jgi:DNA-binding transcriptional MerR regulator